MTKYVHQTKKGERRLREITFAKMMNVSSKTELKLNYDTKTWDEN